MPIRPVRLQLSRRKGFDLQEISRAANGLEAVNVSRGGAGRGLFGNPWRVDSGPGMSREQVVALHRAWITGVASDAEVGHEAAARRRDVLQHLPELRGKNLACTCPLPAPYEPDCCHAAVLLEIANREDPAG
jgi:hypothetical protein